MKELIEDFLQLQPGMQLRFLKGERFLSLDREDRITFLREVLLQEKTSSKVLSSAIKVLRELNCKDKVFYKRFLQHPDSSVVIAARRAIDASTGRSDTDFFRMRELVKRQNREKKLEAVQQVVYMEEGAADDLLISFLSENDLKVRDLVIRELSTREVLDERKLLQLLDHSIWHLKSAVIEILGRRKSEMLFEKADMLVKDANADVRLKLIGALANLNREKAKNLLLLLATDPHVHVRKEAARILAEI